jgi:hypothetical protein
MIGFYVAYKGSPKVINDWFLCAFNRGKWWRVTRFNDEREHIHKKSFLVHETASSLATRLQETSKIPMGRNHRRSWYWLHSPSPGRCTLDCARELGPPPSVACAAAHTHCRRSLLKRAAEGDRAPPHRPRHRAGHISTKGALARARRPPKGPASRLPCPPEELASLNLHLQRKELTACWWGPPRRCLARRLQMLLCYSWIQCMISTIGSALIFPINARVLFTYLSTRLSISTIKKQRIETEADPP